MMWHLREKWEKAGKCKAFSWKGWYESKSSELSEGKRKRYRVVYGTKDKYDVFLEAEANGILLFRSDPLWNTFPSTTAYTASSWPSSQLAALK